MPLEEEAEELFLPAEHLTFKPVFPLRVPVPENVKGTVDGQAKQLHLQWDLQLGGLTLGLFEAQVDVA